MESICYHEYMAQKKKTRWQSLLWILGIIVLIAVIVYAIIAGRHALSRRNIRLMSGYITSYGVYSPYIVIGLIILSTLIPPLPLPIPIIELAAGYMFGFGPGFFLIWFSQIISSLCAFWATRLVGKRVIMFLRKYAIFRTYEHYVVGHGAMGIFVTRATLSAPMNIVSFLAGLTDMGMFSFFTATFLGTIPESLFYPFIGNLIRSTRIRLWYVWIAILLLGSVVPFWLFIKLHTADRKRKE